MPCVVFVVPMDFMAEGGSPAVHPPRTWEAHTAGFSKCFRKAVVMKKARTMKMDHVAGVKCQNQLSTRLSVPLWIGTVVLFDEYANIRAMEMDGKACSLRGAENGTDPWLMATRTLTRV